jgi:glycosyltransferase involved in cell wall biosynthesis
MNLLFITTYYPEPQIGGIERVTYLLSKYLSQHRFSIFNLRFNNSEYDDTFPFINSSQLKNLHDSDSLRQYLINNRINAIINQSHFFYTPIIEAARKNLDVKLYTVFHNRPMFEALKLNEAIKYSSSNLKYIIPFIYPIYKLYSVRKLKREHKLSYLLSDKTILLSSRFIDIYKKDLNIDGKKLTYINNPISFNNVTVDYTKKEKIVLIVARLYEAQKKISIALDIWKEIEPQNSDWKLIIVGDGEDKKYYEEYCRKNNIQNVKFTGRTNPLPYYMKASIFMMTSKNEGWPLTLLEAMQTGVVPIVMDSFAALHDIIQDGSNGYIVKYNDKKEFGNRLISLINNKNLRLKMSQEGLHSCTQYSIDNIGKEWINLLNGHNE